MKKRIAVGAAVCVLLCSCSTLLAAATTDQQKLASHKKELLELRKRIHTLNKELTAAEGTRVEARDRLRNTEQAISNRQKTLYGLAQDKIAQQQQMVKLDDQQKALKTVLNQQRQQIDQLLRYQYQQGEMEALRLILNGDDPNQITRDLHYLALIAQARNALLKDVFDNLKRKQQLGKEVEEKIKQLGDIEKREQDTQKQLLVESRERKRLLTQLSQKIETQRKEIDSLQGDERRLNRLVERLTRIIESRPKPVVPPKRPDKPIQEAGKAPAVTESYRSSDDVGFKPDGAGFGQLKGRLAMPVAGPVRHRFGSVREQGQVWKGIFIQSAEGNPVKAIAAGRVVFAEWMRGFGNLMIIDHNGNYYSIYGYTEALLKEVGDTVKRGDVIARAGSSGGYPESGLYFEIRYKGQPEDPLVWIGSR